MGVLLERKTQVIFVTASSVEQNGKAREVIVESRPLYAVVQLNGSKEKYPSCLGNDLRACQRAARRESPPGSPISEATWTDSPQENSEMKGARAICFSAISLPHALKALRRTLSQRQPLRPSSWPNALLQSCAPGRSAPQESASPSGPYLRQIGSSLDVHERSDLFCLF